jgi:hypothetical protein
VEISASRAGGTTEANIQRWLGQFDDRGTDTRIEKTVRGLHVTVVEVSGTYEGGGAALGVPSDGHRGWTLVGAIVETPGSPYFFKLVGPTPAARAARASFDALLDGITPR